jgi:hypothetical protein
VFPTTKDLQIILYHAGWAGLRVSNTKLMNAKGLEQVRHAALDDALRVFELPFA